MKIGDRGYISCKEQDIADFLEENGIMEGMEGTIVADFPRPDFDVVLVDFEVEFKGGHDGNGILESPMPTNTCFWIFKTDLVVFEE